MFSIVLVEPEIPQNTGNIARTCAATGCKLHLVRPLGFELSDRALKRAGVDYWDLVEVRVYDSLSEVLSSVPPSSHVWFFSAKGERAYADAPFCKGDFLVFGKESTGLGDEILSAHKKDVLRIPVREESRSLNLSNAAAIAVYEALRQNGFEGLAERR